MLTLPLALALAWVNSLRPDHPLARLSRELSEHESQLWRDLGLPHSLSSQSPAIRKTILRLCLLALSLATLASLQNYLAFR